MGAHDEDGRGEGGVVDAVTGVLGRVGVDRVHPVIHKVKTG